jgi:AcrR family transcriptional regulator
MDDTRQRLLNIAGKVFAEKGFTATTIREICTAAEANIASVNYYFGDKERLYVEAVQLAACQGTIPQFDWPPGLPREQKLFQFIQYMLTQMLDEQRPEWQIELMMRELARPTKACEELVRNFIQPMFAQLIQIVSEFFPDKPPERIIHLQAFSIVAQCLLYRYHRPIGRLLIGEEEYRQISSVTTLSEQITAFSLGGLNEAARRQEATR